MRAMVGGCCVCSDEQGWNENPLVYCDGQGCTVAVHQACYGIVTVPTGPWYCRKCESQERAARVRCELCPSKDGALKRTDNGGWAHVVCALYIPEVRFGNVATMEPIILALVPQERYNKVCYLCLESSGRESKASHGACMQCNKAGCKDSFHVTCAQAHGLLCEEAGNYMDNVKYCGYCHHHFQRINKKLVKTIPAFRSVTNDDLSPEESPEKQDSSSLGLKEAAKHLQATSSVSSNSKGKGKRGRKPGSMIYEPKLEPSKFNPDLASLNSSNNCLSNVSNSVTLTPVSSSFSNSENHKGFGTNNSEIIHQPPKVDKVFSDKSSIAPKTPNVVVKIGKHGEIYHAKKDSSPEINHSSVSPLSEPGIPPEAQAILERVPLERVPFERAPLERAPIERAPLERVPVERVPLERVPIERAPIERVPVSTTSIPLPIEVKEEGLAGDKKGFTNANFTESFVTASVSVSDSLIKSDSDNSPPQGETVVVDTSRVKVECPDPESSDQTEIPSSVPPERPEPSHSDKDQSVSSSTNSSNQLLPQPKPPIPEAKVPPQTSSGLSFSLETNLSSVSKTPPCTTNPPISSSSSSVTNMFSRSSQLNNSVSLFPASSPGPPPPPPQHSSVSITPTVTSQNSPQLSVARQATQPVTISPVETSERLPLESPNTAKVGPLAMVSPRSKAKVGNGPVKRIGRPPKPKGTHTTTSSLGPVINVESEDEDGSPGASKKPREDKEEEKVEGTDNGFHRLMMFGATLNPASGMAKEMSTVLQNEVETHSAYSPDVTPQLIGVPLPGRRRGLTDTIRSAPHTVAGMLDPARQPQTLEELLERHWEQGSRFLMEQASHFDIASLLSSLHQLREENLGLEDSVDRLIARRDHLLAVRARLLALNSLTLGSLSQEVRARDQVPVQNGPSQPTGRSLVSPGGRPIVSPVPRDKAQPSPRGPAPLPSPRERGPPLVSPRDRDRSPRLPPHHHPSENGLDPGGHVGYRSHEPPRPPAQLLTVAGLPPNNHRQHSPVGQHPGPPKAHYTHHNSSGGPPRAHPELRGHYPSNYQMVSPPTAPVVKGGAPLPAHSSHPGGIPLVSRSTPPGQRNTPPGQGGPPLSHHNLPPNLHQHMIRSSQASLHPKK